jgi:hypothetical protein
MELTPFIEELDRRLAVAAEAVGDEGRATAERLVASLESAVRLTLLELLSAAADEITQELAPGSVEVRLRSGEPELVVTLPPLDEPVEAPPPPPPPEGDEGDIARISLRLPEHLKAGVDQAAAHGHISANAWLVRTIATALGADHPRTRPPQRGGRVGQSFSGWVS